VSSCLSLVLSIVVLTARISLDGRHTPPLPDALPISIEQSGARTEIDVALVAPDADDAEVVRAIRVDQVHADVLTRARREEAGCVDRKSTRLNSSHVKISYADFCLKKKTTYSLLTMQ